MQNRFLLPGEGKNFELPTIRLDDLQLNNLALFQDAKSYCFTSDSVLLANFAVAKKSHNVVDLCSGSGIVGILVAHKTQCKRVVLVEMQEKLALLSAKSVEYNHLEHQIEVLNTKVQQVNNFLPAGSVDVVVCNPPYAKKAGSYASLNPEIAMARIEIELRLEDVINQSSYLLKQGGKLFICMMACRSAELLSTLAKFHLQPKKVFFTYPSTSKQAFSVFVEAVKGGKEGVIVLPPVIANDADGNYLPSIRALFKGE